MVWFHKVRATLQATAVVLVQVLVNQQVQVRQLAIRGLVKVKVIAVVLQPA
ncbi:hypothetical protein NUITMVRE34_13250 [Enterococcus gallinarum]|nr:hypothetical protein AH4_26010 [Enterococcus gallinarum]GMS48045.1 hypothetical protein NUITMVRE34_13250 [Enterococcus gallinarum]GMS51191.1 hypothetical protein NUITMVRE35_13260 [Enterococcus gallinarum]